jgi:hypothetical protein
MCAVAHSSPCHGQSRGGIKKKRKRDLWPAAKRAIIFAMTYTNFIFALIAAAMAYFIIKRTMAKAERQRQIPNLLFAEVAALFIDPAIKPGESLGSHVLTGTYNNNEFEIKTITDTLNTRKLPSLWLMITLKSPIPIKHTLDMMLRPAGPSTFSNFDFLPVIIQAPSGFPEQAVLHSDEDHSPFDLNLLKPLLSFFDNPRAKEFLATPNGLRLVTQLGEAERARYLVAREARFESATIDAHETKNAIELLLALENDLQQRHAHD